MENPSGAAARILIVEDATIQAKKLKFHLEKLGYDVTWMQNGKLALERLDDEPFDLVISDIQMPVMDGLELLREVRRRSQLKRIPFIIITTLDDEEVSQKSAQSGASDFIVKPFKANELALRVGNLLDKRRLEFQAKAHLAAIESSTDGVAILNHEGEFVFANETHARVFGYYCQEDILGSHWANLYDERELARIRTEVLPIFMKEGSWVGELTAKRKDGSPYPQEVSMTRLEDGGFLTICRDITERKKQQEALRKKTDELEKAKTEALRLSQIKTDFLANMSHEIRTPLNAIVGTADLLVDADVPDEVLSYIQTQQRAAQTLLTIVNDVLDISKIEAGQLTLEKIQIDLVEVISNCIEMMETNAIKKGLVLRTEVDARIKSFYVGDPTRLTQILMNLVGNAIKFTSKGGVQVILGENQGDQPGNLHARVVDTGIGIPKDKLDEVFESFSQADNSVTRKHGGTGLGLSICRHLVRMMGGDIWVESEVGVGTTFHFTLDLPRVGSGTKVDSVVKESQEIEQYETPLRILLADDSEDNCFLVKAFLGKTSHSLTAVENGSLALEKVKSETFDLILMDMQMPVMDGHTATKEIRKWEAMNGKTPTPILAFTAHALREEVQKSLDVGCDGHLSKPLKKAVLIEAIRKFSTTKKAA